MNLPEHAAAPGRETEGVANTTGRVVTIVPNREPQSRQCVRHRAEPSDEWCGLCGIRRRRDAASRMSPMPDGRRDPLSLQPLDGAA